MVLKIKTKPSRIKLKKKRKGDNLPQTFSKNTKLGKKIKTRVR